MSKRSSVWLTSVLVLSLVLAGCVAVQPQTGAPGGAPSARESESYHWWTAPGDREAADAMFAALNDTYGMTVQAPHPDATMDWLRVVASPKLQIPTDVTQGGVFAQVLFIFVGIAPVSIIIFTQVWNRSFLALTLSSRETQTVQGVMVEAKGTTLVLYNLQMAAALIAIGIPRIFFLVLGRDSIRGLLAGARKG